MFFVAEHISGSSTSINCISSLWFYQHSNTNISNKSTN